MRWEDDGIVLHLQPFSDNKQLLTLFTHSHGVHKGMVRGKKTIMPILQPGNNVRCSWNARIESQLGSYTVELSHSVMPQILAHHPKLLAVQSLVHLCYYFLPERDPHPEFFTALQDFLQQLHQPDWLEQFAKIEAQFARETGTLPDADSLQRTFATEGISPHASTIDALRANGYVLSTYVAEALDRPLSHARAELMQLLQ